MAAAPSSRSTARAALNALLAGAAATVGLYAAMKIVRAYDLNLGQYGKLAISLTLFFLGGAAGGVTAGRYEASLRSAAMAFGALLIGVAAGVVAWNALEDHVFSRFSPALYQERKLFPVDVMLMWMLGWAPLLAGLAAGMFFGAGGRRKST
jgi:hypothetical protein